MSKVAGVVFTVVAIPVGIMFGVVVWGRILLVNPWSKALR